jgi:phosphatidylglycerophosphatase A
MPGTFGTLAGMGIAWAAMGAPPWALLVLAAIVAVGSVPLARAAEQEGGREDPGWFVLDEVAGYLVAVLWLPLSWPVLALAFLAFRLFDIWKPWPVRRLESVQGGWGVVLDDLMAGVYANILVRLVLPWL